MANTLYPKGREHFLDGDISWSADDIKVVLVDSTYVYDTAHEFLDDVAGSARIATSANLSGKTITDGVADANNVTFSAVAGGDTVDAYIIYHDSGVEGTSELILYADRNSSGIEFAEATDGSDIILTWSEAATKIFRL